MGYNTRRKSLSLSELGITLPKRQRAQSHPSPPSTVAEGDESDRPSKKSRLMSPPQIKEEENGKPTAAQLSPPPSPAAEGGRNKVDVEGIGDDIVVSTIRQLEQTGNRPHLVKELGAVLATSLHSVEKSANPSALISSRLTAYLNRAWPAISPCPLAKDLSPVHPRRLYFYLTTMPRQPIPETVAEPLPKATNNRIISPSLSSASAADEEEGEGNYRYNRSRDAMSPSPEVDLSSPELEDEEAQEPPTPGAPFSGRSSVERSRSASAPNHHHLHNHHHRRGASPQLENEERDFKQTANALYEQAQQAQQRRNSQQAQQSRSQSQDVDMEGSAAAAGADAVAGAEQLPDAAGSVSTSIEGQQRQEAGEAEAESEESTAQKNSEDATALFGPAGGDLKTDLQIEFFSSPVIRPARGDHASSASDEKKQHDEVMDLDTSMHVSEWDILQSPENVDVAELEDMFDAY